jgi:hypothetical protein
MLKNILLIILFSIFTLLNAQLAVNPYLTNPAPNSTLTTSSVTFRWNSNGVTALTGYSLSIGNFPGGATIYNSGFLSSTITSRTVTGLPLNGSTFYVRLSYRLNMSWYSKNYTFQASNASPFLISPTPNSTLSSSSATFQWNSSGATGLTGYSLAIGNFLGGATIYNSGILSSTITSRTVTGLPLNGSTIYVRLSYRLNISWYNKDYSFQASNASPFLISPTPNSTLSSSSVTFQWNSNGATGLTGYSLTIGNFLGGATIYNSGILLSSTTSRTVTGLPLNGSTFYVRLSYRLNMSWYNKDYAFQASNAIPALVSPAPGSGLTTYSVTFQWNSNGAMVTEYFLYVGTSAGGDDIYNSGFLSSTITSKTVSGFPENGSLIFVRLWFKINGTWNYKNYLFIS